MSTVAMLFWLSGTTVCLGQVTSGGDLVVGEEGIRLGRTARSSETRILRLAQIVHDGGGGGLFSVLLDERLREAVAHGTGIGPGKPIVAVANVSALSAVSGGGGDL
jgi:hypothetical protein